MITRINHCGKNEQALNSSEYKNSQADLIETLQLQLERLCSENLIQKHTISSLQKKQLVLEDELDDCERDITELETETRKWKIKSKP